MVEPILLLVAFALGLATGGFSNVTSGGAGIFSIYFLTNYARMTIQNSTGTVLAASTVIVLIGAVSFYRKGQVETRLALTVGLSGVIGAFVAARFASTVQSVTLEEAFGAFTLVLAAYVAIRIVSSWRRKVSFDGSPLKSKRGDPPFPTEAPTAKSYPSRWAGRTLSATVVQISGGVIIGVATGVFGVGLASLSVVLFMLFFKLEINMVLGTSLIASFFRYLGGSVGYLTTGLIDPTYFVVLVAGGGIGSIIGARVVLRKGKGSKELYIRAIVVGMLLFISYEFLFKRLIMGSP